MFLGTFLVFLFSMRIAKKLLIVFFSLLLLAAAGLFTLYWGSQHVPEFYQQAIEADPAEQRVASNEMFNSTAALVRDSRTEGRWEATFTVEQINGWLAVDLVENYPHLLSSNVKEPRVDIQEDKATLAFRYTDDSISSVLSFTFNVELLEENLVALRIHKARAGRIPMPLKDVLQEISNAAKELNLKLIWDDEDGDPVALITIPTLRDESDKRLWLESIELGQGKVSFSGYTERITSPAHDKEDHPPVAVFRVSNVKIQP